MARISWDKIAERYFEIGVSRGVFFLKLEKEPEEIEPYYEASKKVKSYIDYSMENGITGDPESIPDEQGWVILDGEEDPDSGNTSTPSANDEEEDEDISEYYPGVAWNGLSSVEIQPDGADPNAIWSGDVKYGDLRSPECLAGTISALSFPTQFRLCDGTGIPTDGLYIGQQTRREFGFCYRTELLSDMNPEHGYLLHVVYNCTVGPSEKEYVSVSESEDALLYTWEFKATPVELSGYLPFNEMVFDSTKIPTDKMRALENCLYGTEETEPTLPSPGNLLGIIGGEPYDPWPDKSGDDLARKIIERVDGLVVENNASYVATSVFNHWENLIALNLPSCITIETSAFQSCTALTTATFPACTTIGEFAFESCYALTSATFPACTSIGSSAFENCTALTSATFPACTTIGESAFMYCYALTSANFPACTTIGEFAFESCIALTTATFPVCTAIGEGVFYACRSLTTATFPACTTIGEFAFESCYALTSATFPACTSIGSSAFENCTALTSATFPACTTIGEFAFENCTALTSANFPACTTINSYALRFCYALTSVTFPTCMMIGEGAFQNCRALISVTFPACTSIGPYAFYACRSLTTATFPVCTTIGEGAFESCTALTTETFPACTSIGPYAFMHCYALTSVTFPACTSIGPYAFYACRSLTTATFPVCTTIGEGAFSYCEKLKYLYLFSTSMTRVGDSNAFYRTLISTQGSVFVRASLLTDYKTDSVWSWYADRIVGLTDEEINALNI